MTPQTGFPAADPSRRSLATGGAEQLLVSLFVVDQRTDSTAEIRDEEYKVITTRTTGGW